MERVSRLIDRLSDFIANRKGLLPLAGLALILVNLVLQIFPAGWLTTSHFFLHIGLILAFLGLLIGRAL